MLILILHCFNHYNLTLLILFLVFHLVSLSTTQQLTEEKADGLANEAARSVSHVLVTL